MRFALAGLLAMALAACSDASTMAPTLPPTDEPPGSLAEAPFRDALERIVPSLGTGPAATALQAALTAAWENRSSASIPAIESALQRLESEQPDAAVEADVIRLAVTAQP